ncbi:MAG: PaaI family thioesterase [Syntrophomonadaceae bacterium]|jgi:acyl-CoA thioesterase
MKNKVITYLEKDRFAAYIGAKLIKVEPGYALGQLEIADKHLNAVNIVQGGVIFTLADYVFGAASNSYGHVALSINANISYYKPPKGKIITAEAREISATKKIANYNVDIFDEKHNLIARFNGTAYKKNEEILSYID